MERLRMAAVAFMNGNRGSAVLRIFMGLLFIYSGTFKAVDPENFSRVIQNYEILPSILVPYSALFIPYVEIITGLLLVIGYKIRPASLVLFLLMLAFTGAIAVNVLRGRTFDCGCFELKIFGINENVSPGLVIRDLVFAGILLVIFNGKKFFYSRDGRDGM